MSFHKVTMAHMCGKLPIPKHVVYAAEKLQMQWNKKRDLTKQDIPTVS